MTLATPRPAGLRTLDVLGGQLSEQLALYGVRPTIQAPSTRYQGSKLKLLPWLAETFDSLSFDTALDAFSGTASVSYLLKQRGKSVTANDYLRSNFLVSSALIENGDMHLSEEDLDFILTEQPPFHYDNFIARTFGGIYFTDTENEWLDLVSQNIQLLSPYKRAVASYALFQAALVKRPYNLFHRSNLYLREANVSRTFGNKVTWDTPFEDHYRAFVEGANRSVFSTGATCVASCRDALEVEGKFDLVYIDTPYINHRGVGVDYLDFYHFLEGLSDYSRWPERVDYSRKHRPFRPQRSDWSSPQKITGAFERLFERYSDSILVVSYRSDGIPQPDVLRSALERVKDKVTVRTFAGYKYVLSTKRDSDEMLLVGE